MDYKNKSYQAKLARLRKKATTLARKHGLEQGYRSGLEFKIAKALTDQNINFEFEGEKVPYTARPIKHHYFPDFIVVTQSGKKLVIESKGRFMPDDMEKHLAIKEQHTNFEVRFVFQHKNGWFRKAKRRTYAKWCEENGFKYCDFREFNNIMKEWIKE